MKLMTAIAVVVFCLTGVAMADYMVDAHLYYPDATSWQLYVKEINVADPAAPTAAEMSTAAGLGIASVNVTVRGALVGSGTSFVDGDWSNKQDVKAGTTLKGSLGFATLGSFDGFTDSNGMGYVQCLGSIDTSNWANLQTYGFGVQAGQYKPGTANIPAGAGFTPTSTWKIGGVSGATWSYAAPSNLAWVDDDGAADGAAMGFTGVCVWAGARPAGGQMYIDTDPQFSSCNVFSDYVGTLTGANLAVLAPEPATIALVVLGGLAALRRRR